MKSLWTLFENHLAVGSYRVSSVIHCISSLFKIVIPTNSAKMFL